MQRAFIASLSHRVPVRPLDGGLPLVFTFDITRGPGGLFLVTYRDLPEVLIVGPGEHDALVHAELEIRHLLAPRHPFLPLS